MPWYEGGESVLGISRKLEVAKKICQDSAGKELEWIQDPVEWTATGSSEDYAEKLN
jgi:hypothetical protein